MSAIRFGGLCGVREGGVRSVENVECGKWGLWKMRSVENEECGKMRSVENFPFQFSIPMRKNSVEEQLEC